MRDERLKKQLERAFPPTPAVFHARMAQIAADTRAQKRISRRRALRLAMICLTLMALGGAAVAAMNHYGVLNFNSGWDDSYYFSLPEAQDMIQYNLACETTGALEWRVKEAIYDGRVLRVLYAVRDTAAREPFSSADPEDEQSSAWSAYWAMCQREGVFLKSDGNGEIFVNGQGVNLESVDMRLGGLPGEVEGWMDCRMSYYNPDTEKYEEIRPEGVLEISLPFAFEKEGIEEQSSAAALSFRLSAGDAASRYALALPPAQKLPTGAELTFTDLHFSPATVFITFEINIPADRLPEERPDLQDFTVFDSLLDNLPEYTHAAKVWLENSRGEKLGVSKDEWMAFAYNEAGGLTLTHHCEFTPSERYTNPLTLCLKNWRVSLPLEYQNP